MHVTRRIALVLLMLALLPWGAHLGAAAASQTTREPAASAIAAAAAPRVALRSGTCRTALPVGPCHLDHVAFAAEAEASVGPRPRLRAEGDALASGHSEPPGHPPPRSF